MKNFILNTEITFTDYDTLFRLIYDNAEQRKKFTVAYANSYLCNYVLKHDMLNDCLSKFDLVHADGIGVHLASKFLYRQKEHWERVNGTDLYFKLLSDERKTGFFILGGPEKTVELLEGKFGDKVYGFIYQITDNENDIDTINKSGADILLVALGTPEQETWIIKNKDKINVPVIIAVGSGIDYLTGRKKRAPLIMRKTGLEWFFRLIQEPLRLWKRYLIINPVFIFKIVRQKVNLLTKTVNT